MRIRSVSFVAISLFLAGSQACGIPFGDAWFSFEGVARTPNGQPIEGATLTIFVNEKLAGDTSTTITDSQGHYQLHENSCPCEFKFELVATKPGYGEVRISKTPSEANSMRRLDIVL